MWNLFCFSVSFIIYILTAFIYPLGLGSNMFFCFFLPTEAVSASLWASRVRPKAGAGSKYYQIWTWFQRLWSHSAKCVWHDAEILKFDPSSRDEAVLRMGKHMFFEILWYISLVLCCLIAILILKGTYHEESNFPWSFEIKESNVLENILYVQNSKCLPPVKTDNLLKLSHKDFSFWNRNQLT